VYSFVRDGLILASPLVYKRNEESEALTNGWLEDELVLCFTDEMQNDIDRNPSQQEKEQSRSYLQAFAPLKYEHKVFRAAEDSLKKYFPDVLTDRDKSDLRHLAKTIASGSQFFITRDQGLLNLEGVVNDAYGVKIVRPAYLITHLDELRRNVAYEPARFSGTQLSVKLIQSRDNDNLLVEHLQCRTEGETKSAFLKQLHRYLADPDRYTCKVVWSIDEKPLALFVCDRYIVDELNIVMLRVSKGPLASTLARHMILYSVELSAKEGRAFTKISDTYIDQVIKSAIVEDAFVPVSNSWLKISLPVAESTLALADRLYALAKRSEEAQEYCVKLAQDLCVDGIAENTPIMMSLERLLWPAKIIDADIPSYIVPIQPRWAQHLFDEGLANQTLFGARDDLALLRENVYYRSNSHNRLLKPGRILWYVSKDTRYQGSMQLRACSYLDEIVVDEPKVLFRQFKHLGVYEWADIFQVAKYNINNHIMALRISDPELFSTPITRHSLLQILGHNATFQSPMRMTKEVFAQLYTMGTQRKS
jgi:predicted nucleic acid-binding protein